MCFISDVYKGYCSLQTIFFKSLGQYALTFNRRLFFGLLNFKIPHSLNEILYNPVFCLYFIVLSFFLNVSVVPK